MGKLLVSGSDGSGCNVSGTLFVPDECHNKQTIAADLLPAPGLELAAGNTVYHLELNNLNGVTGNIMTPVFADSPVKDGLTSVGDIDGDGELDVIVVRNQYHPGGGGIWIWNPRTGGIIASSPAGTNGGVPFIGDIDGDCLPEIGMTFSFELRMYKYDGASNLKLMYSIPTSDHSGITGISMFDFNQDGKNELVYRDETDLRIMEGSSGKTFASYPIKSGTGMEYPVIADIDNDGQAEIIVNGYILESEQRIFCFESDGEPWAPARSIWNQPGYNITNVNDDFTIPRHPQNNAKALPGSQNCSRPTCSTPYNNFMTQATYRTQEGCVQFPAIDLAIDILDFNCQQDSFSICMIISNNGSKELVTEPVEITCWPSNPLVFDFSSIATTTIPLTLKPGQSDTFCISDQVMPWQDSMFVVVNDPGTAPAPYTFPLTDLVECEYGNNMDVFYLNLSTRTLDLGPDIIKCASQVVTLNAGPDFIHYLWNDGTTDSLYSSGFDGLHFVEATDHCGRVYHDTIRITFDTFDQVHLGPDVSICPGEQKEYSLAGNYDWVRWLPSSAVNCDTCAIMSFATDTSFSLIAVAGKDNCISADTVDIQIHQPVISNSFASICEGESILYRDSLLFDAGQYIFQVEPCDSIFTLDLSVFENDTTLLDHTICEGDSLLFNDSWVKSEGLYILPISNVHGCDSTVYLNLFETDEIIIQESLSICEGDSIQIFGQWVDTDTLISEKFQSQAGCDSTQYFDISFSPFQYQLDTLNICEGDSIWLANGWVTTGGKYIDTIDAVPCKMIRSTHLDVMPVVYSESNIHLCPGDSLWLDNKWIKESGEIQHTLTTIHGCDSIQTIRVIIPEKPPGPDFEIDCERAEVRASILAGAPWTIVWDNGDQSQSTTYSSGDSAQVTLYADPDCQIAYHLDLPTLPDLLSFPQFEDLLFSEHATFAIALDLDTSTWSVQWSPVEIFSCPTCISTEIHPDEDVVIGITLIHSSGCLYAESFTIRIEETLGIYIPNVFSPNGDGVNDEWVISFFGDKSQIETVEIFDKWGTVLRVWNDTNDITWDGKFSGEIVNPGVYVYSIFYRNEEGKLLLKKGDLTLLR